MNDVNQKMKIMGISGYDSIGTFTPEEHMQFLDEMVRIRNRRALRCLEDEEQDAK